MRILICGDRDWANPVRMLAEMERLASGTVVIHGAARGADSIAGGIAEGLRLGVEVYPADWKRYGRSAGPIRNRQMLDEGKPDEVWAFHDDLNNSKGTLNMVIQARKAGVPVRIFTQTGEVNANQNRAVAP